MENRLFRIAELALLGIIATVLILGQFRHSETGTTTAPQNIIHLTQWKVSDDGNGHWYGVLDVELYWEQAATLASTLEVDGQRGYLATITSYEENQFINDRVIANTSQPSILDAYWLGGKKEGDHWLWVTGEAWEFKFWSEYEPNNAAVETALSIWGKNNWDERVQPGRWNNLLPNGAINNLHLIWAVVEWGAPVIRQNPPLPR